MRSMHAGGSVLPDPFDLVLQLQFASFELHDSQIIDRGMGQAFGYFLFERLMSFFQFREVRLHRHNVMSPQSVALQHLSVAQIVYKIDRTPGLALRQTGAKAFVAELFTKA